MQSRGFEANLRHLAMRRLERREVAILAGFVALLAAFVWAAHVLHATKWLVFP
jgi:hypothetical protein